MTNLLRQVHKMVRSWNLTYRDRKVPTEWVEEYILAGLWLQACSQTAAPEHEVFSATLRRLEFAYLLRNTAPELLDQLDQLVATS